MKVLNSYEEEEKSGRSSYSETVGRDGMKQQFPDYENCIANLANSILEKFEIHENRQKLNALEKYLNKDYENIVLILLDGMGKNIIQNNLDGNGFFNSHLAGTYSSVFPPTTVAATTSIANGLTPCEHGWLGWDCYYPQIDKIYSTREEADFFMGVHAGLTEDEMTIPLIVIERK